VGLRLGSPCAARCRRSDPPVCRDGREPVTTKARAGVIAIGPARAQSSNVALASYPRRPEYRTRWEAGQGPAPATTEARAGSRFNPRLGLDGAGFPQDRNRPVVSIGPRGKASPCPLVPVNDSGPGRVAIQAPARTSQRGVRLMRVNPTHPHHRSSRAGKQTPAPLTTKARARVFANPRPGPVQVSRMAPARGAVQEYRATREAKQPPCPY
jgi:hypothetical protein